MRKIKLLSLILISLMVLSGAGLVATVANYGVNVNGQPLDATVLNQNGTTYLPLKAVGQALGADVSWTGGSVEIETVDIEALKEACVMIDAQSSTKASQGSAVAWDYGEYLTANHVVADGRTNIVSDIDLHVGKTDAKLDIATLTTDDNVKPVKIGDSDEVKAGDTVILIGSPNWEKNTVRYSKVEYGGDDKYMIISETVGGGFSGGAVFNLKGELVGIITSGNDFANDCYATPINLIREAF